MNFPGCNDLYLDSSLFLPVCDQTFLQGNGYIRYNAYSNNDISLSINVQYLDHIIYIYIYMYSYHDRSISYLDDVDILSSEYSLKLYRKKVTLVLFSLQV